MSVDLTPSIDRYQAELFVRSNANAIAALIPNQARLFWGRLTPEQRRSLVGWDGTARNMLADKIIRAAVTQAVLRQWPTYDWTTYANANPVEARKPHARERLRRELLRVVQLSDQAFRKHWSGRAGLIRMLLKLASGVSGLLGEADQGQPRREWAETNGGARLAPLYEFEQLAEADHADRPAWRRQRAGLPPSRERIRVDRARSDRARLRTKAGEDRRRHRQAVLMLLRKRSASAFKRGIERTIIPGRLPPWLVQQWINAANSDFLQSMTRLLGDADGSADLGTAMFSAAAASAVATSANRLGIVDKVNVEGVAKAVNQILASELPPALKAIGTAIAVAAHSKPLREAELLP